MENKNFVIYAFVIFSLALIGSSCDRSKSSKIDTLRPANKVATSNSKKSKKSKPGPVRDADGNVVTWELESAVKKNPGSIELNYELAQSYFRSGKYDKAANLYRLCTVFAGNDKDSSDFLSEQTLAEQQESFRYLELLSRFRSADKINVECDLAPMSDVLALCDEFERDYGKSAWLSDISDIRKTCRQKLLFKNQAVFDFHCNNWLNKSLSQDSREVAQRDRQAAEKVLERIRKEFDLSDPEVASRVAFSEYKMTNVEYQIAKQKSAELAVLLKKHPKDSDKLKRKSATLSAEEAARGVMLQKLASLEHGFAQSKEVKSALAMTDKQLVVSVLA